MDLFTERLMVKKPGAKEISLCILLFLAAALISVLAYFFLPWIFIIILAVAFFGAYYLSSGILFTEIEYTVTNQEFDIDKIIAKRNRRHLKSYKINEFSEGGRYDGQEGEFLCPDKNSDNLYYLVKENEGKREVIIIDPNETMLRCFEIYMGQRFKR